MTKNGEPTVVWVDDDFTNSTPSWGTTHFNKIQDGITAVAVGGTVNVAAGTYHNDIYSLTKQVILLGENEAIVTRDGGGEFRIESTAIGTTINGIKFGSSTANSGGRIFVNNAEDVTIKYCIFQNSTSHGVAIESGAHGAVISYNTFSKTAWEAIANFGASDVVLSNNTIGDIPTNYGIYLSAGSNTKVKDNFISDTFQEAIRCDGTTVISGNTITDIGNKGIFLGASSSAIVSNNFISETTYEGIQANAPATITGNDISGFWHGIQIRNHATGTIIKWNKIHDNTYHGIEIPNYDGSEPNVTGVTITNNIFANNGHTGIKVGGGLDGSGININYNSFEGNGIFGVESETKTEGLYVDATRNWWGHASGPGGVYGRTNPAGKIIGKGDAVSNYVDWDPWLSQPTVPPTQILNKWDLKGSFVAHPGYNWGGLAEGATWEYSIHIKEAMNGDFSVGSIHFSTGDINVTGIVEQTKSAYAYWTSPNLAAAGRAEYDGITYNFFFLYSEKAIWFALSQADLEPSWSQETVWGGSLREYQLHSLNPGTTVIWDPKIIH